MIRRVPVHPVTVPLALVLLVWSGHTDEVAPAMVRTPLVLAMIVPVTATLVAAAAMRDLRRGAIFGTVTSILWLFHEPLWSLVPWDAPLWGRMLLSLVLVAGAVVWARRAPADVLGRSTATWNVLGLLAVLALAVPVVTGGTFARATTVETPDVVAGADLPDVVWIVPDRYGSATSLATRFGIDSTGFEEALAERGFAVARDARANYPRTVMSLAAQLNLSYLDGPIDGLPDDADGAVTPLYPLLEDHAVGRLLRDVGYDYVHISSWWTPTMDASSATDVLGAGRSTEFGRVVERTTLGPAIGLQVNDLPLYDHGLLHRVVNVAGLDALERQVELLATDTDDAPRFVFAHIALPHEPYVFDQNGAPPAGSEWTEAEAFDRQRRYLDDRLLAIIDSVPAPGDGGPVIMLLADEGPHPRNYHAAAWVWEDAADDDLVAKLSILAAVRGRAVTPGDMAEGISGVNVARLFIADALGIELPQLEDRSFVYRSPGAVHDYLDVTHRLDEALGAAVRE